MANSFPLQTTRAVSPWEQAREAPALGDEQTGQNEGRRRPGAGLGNGGETDKFVEGVAAEGDLDGAIAGGAVKGDVALIVGGSEISGQAVEEKTIAAGAADERSVRPVQNIEDGAGGVAGEAAKGEDAGIAGAEIEGGSGGESKSADMAGSVNRAARFGEATGVEGAAVQADSDGIADVAAAAVEKQGAAAVDGDVAGYANEAADAGLEGAAADGGAAVQVRAREREEAGPVLDQFAVLDHG